ncbi:Hypothetical protein PHPALM_216 [Phytophthora palmivora]|uniref:Uncharacterized protein n=1 Tax=Phytophthora palmivora TaxID=4796 RepID=A0A2P4YVD8_9STRA|nr:Hypothetical protein PHPALM_216 [Phytophthora palmivora]
MTADAKSGGGLEKFNVKSYTMWKDKLLTHVNQLDLEYQTKLLEKRQPEAKVLMADFLRSNPQKPPSPTNETDEHEALAMRTDESTVPGAKKAKTFKSTSINTIKAVVNEGKRHLNEDGKTLLETCADDAVMDDIESLDPAHHEGFDDNGNTAQTPPQSMEGIEDEAEP